MSVPHAGGDANPLASVERFAHESEHRFARILDFYGVQWEYEPVEFALEWDPSGRPTSGFRPDFWLPEPGLFVEVTTLNQRLVTKKNGKVRRMSQLYPDVQGHGPLPAGHVGPPGQIRACWRRTRVPRYRTHRLTACAGNLSTWAIPRRHSAEPLLPSPVGLCATPD